MLGRRAAAAAAAPRCPECGVLVPTDLLRIERAQLQMVDRVILLGFQSAMVLAAWGGLVAVVPSPTLERGVEILVRGGLTLGALAGLAALWWFRGRRVIAILGLRLTVLSMVTSALVLAAIPAVVFGLPFSAIAIFTAGSVPGSAVALAFLVLFVALAAGTAVATRRLHAACRRRVVRVIETHPEILDS